MHGDLYAFIETGFEANKPHQARWHRETEVEMFLVEVHAPDF